MESVQQSADADSNKVLHLSTSDTFADTSVNDLSSSTQLPQQSNDDNAIECSDVNTFSAPAPPPQSTPDEVIDFYKAEYEKISKTLTTLQVKYDQDKVKFKQDLSKVKEKNAELVHEITQTKEIVEAGVNRATMKALEDEIARLKSVIVDLETMNDLYTESASSHQYAALQAFVNRKSQPLIIRKLTNFSDSSSWNAYLTFNDEENFAKLGLKTKLFRKRLVVNDVVCSSSSKFSINGIVSQYDANPFNGKANCNEDGIVCPGFPLLKKVRYCHITDLFLHHQILSIEEFHILVSAGRVRNLYFTKVLVENSFHDTVPLESLMQYLPLIENFRYDNAGITIRNPFFDYHSITRATFKNLLKLPTFTKLKEFKLYRLIYRTFDVESFFEFMKKHPNANFTLSFVFPEMTDEEESQLPAITKMILGACPIPAKLRIEF